MVTLIRRIYEKIIHEYMILKLKKNNINKNAERVPVVVSLTTYPERFDSIKETLKSLLCQTVIPYKIVVWLGSDCKNYSINEIFENEIRAGIEFKEDKNKNIYSHKKYYYSMQYYSNYPIILVDDDLIYPTNMIESLWKMHRQHPNCIIARRVHKIKWDSNDCIAPYTEWNGSHKEYNKKIYGYFFTSGAGTLFPKSYYKKEIFNLDEINTLTPFADDVWLNFMAYKFKIPLVLIKNGIPMPATVKGSQNSALAYENYGNNRNDIYIKNMIQYLNLKKQDIEWR